MHASLVDALLDLSAVEAECQSVGTAASLGSEQPSLANVAAEAICGIKIQVRVSASLESYLLRPLAVLSQCIAGSFGGVPLIMCVSCC